MHDIFVVFVRHGGERDICVCAVYTWCCYT